MENQKRLIEGERRVPAYREEFVEVNVDLVAVEL